MPWGRRRVIAKRDDVKPMTRKKYGSRRTPKEPKKSKKGERKNENNAIENR